METNNQSKNTSRWFSSNVQIGFFLIFVIFSIIRFKEGVNMGFNLVTTSGLIGFLFLALAKKFFPQSIVAQKFKIINNLWLIVLVISLSLLAFFRYQEIKQEKLEPRQEEIINETADWKTYKNENLGFEIKYPSDLAVSGEGLFSTGSGVTFSKGKNEIFLVWYGVHYSQALTREYTMEEWIDASFPSLREGEIKKNIKFGVGNYDGIRVDAYKQVGVIKLIPYVFAKINNNRNIWELNGNIPTVSTDLPKDYDTYKIFNQMLSTFRFLE